MASPLNSRAYPDVSRLPVETCARAGVDQLQSVDPRHTFPVRIVAQGGPPKGLRRFQVFASDDSHQAPVTCDQCVSSSVLHVCPSDFARQQ